MFARVPRTLIAGVVVATAPAAFAQISFDTASNLGVGNQPDQTAIGDFNRDGFQDLAVTSDNPDRVSVLFGNGDGTFGAPVNTNLPNSSSPGAVGAADADCDGDIDLIVVLRDFETVQLVQNNGNGTFTPGAQFATGARPVDLDLGRLNGDAFVDVAVSNRDGNSVTVLLNNGAGGFASTTFATGAEPRHLVAADLDQNGTVDLAVACADSRSVQLHWNNGAGSFTAGPSLSVGIQLRPEGIDAADLDGDGDNDLATSTSDNALHQMSIFMQTGPGTFTGPTNFNVSGVEPGAVVAADFDFDGDVDVATANKTSNDVSVLPNLGAGTFGAATVLAAGTSPEHIAAGDFDGNQTADLVVTNTDSNSLSVYDNLAASPWSDLGQALAGTRGNPILEPSGSLVGGTPTTFFLDNALPSTISLWFIGFSELNAPFAGGVLVPALDLIIPGLPIDACGQQNISLGWPAGFPAGTEVIFQVWIADAGAVKGLSATNAVKATQP